MDRRIFLRWLGLGAAATSARVFLPALPLVGEERSVPFEGLTFHGKPIIEDIYTPDRPLVSLDEINAIMTKKIVPAVVDYLFQSSPLLAYLKQEQHPPFNRRFIRAHQEV